MIKYLSVFVCILLLAACSNDKKHPVGSEKNEGAETKASKLHYANTLLNQYEFYIDSLKSNDTATADVAINRYTQTFKTGDDATRDSAFLIFSKYYDRLCIKQDSARRKKVDSSLVGDNHAPAAGYVAKLKQNGLGIIKEDGYTYIGQDRDFIAKHFYQYLSPVMKQYLEKINQESREACVQKNKLVIGAKALVERAMWWEQFVKAHPHFISVGYAAIIQKSYLQLLFQGTDFSYVIADNNSITPYFNEAYKYLCDKYPASYAAKMVKPYYDLLLAGSKLQADKLMNTYFKQGVTG
jgi:hypothetical protein